MEIRTVAYDHPDARLLIDEVQQEYVVRYGGVDSTLVDPAEFSPPHGLFLIGYLDGDPVTCGGWRAHEPETVELKRMYVVPRARGTGLARALLAELESSAQRAGHRRLVLETGRKQPEAVALYRSCGYLNVPKFGFYADAPESIHLGKHL